MSDLNYKNVYQKTKKESSAGKDVKMSWEGKTLTTAQMKNRYIPTESKLKRN